MTCTDCGGKLKVDRFCRGVRLKCQKCGREYRVHEVADRLDEETEEILANYTSIIYD